MSGAAIELDLGLAARALGRLTQDELGLIAYEIGTLLEDQSRVRIADEKTAPDGRRWLPWSEAYDDTRNHAKHSLLVGEGHLRESVQNYTTGLDAIVGSNLVYAAVHQHGSDAAKRPATAGEGWGIPAREYLGLSADNRDAIEALVVGRIEELLQ